MLAVYATSANADDPLAAVEVGERPEPEPGDGWTTVDVRATALNHHDVWSLRGVGLDPELLPMILGCDAAGVDADGNEVVVHSVIGSEDWHGDETLDPKRTLLSELHQGTFAERVAVPRHNLIPKPADLSFEQAACLPTAWLTAYRMLFIRGGAEPGQTVLIQGGSGGVATAAILLASAAGLRVWVTSRTDEKRAAAEELGAHQSFESGERLPEKVDLVLETVGEATWKHSLRAVKPGGTVVVSGSTSGPNPSAELQRVFFLQLDIRGSTMGTRSELEQLIRLCEVSGIRPPVDEVMPLSDAPDALAAMVAGEHFGKLVLTPG